MASSVKETDITELRAAGYLAKEIAHRLPARGQIIPTPKPNERVVFIPHFICGLGFPLHPLLQKNDTSVTFWAERNFFLSYL